MKKTFLSFAIAASASIFMLTACNDPKKTDETTVTSTDTTAKMAEQPKMAEEQGVMVGGANMVPSKNIVENAAGSADHTTLVAAVKAAGLAEILSGAGPFTVFAPTNEAFTKLPAGAVENLLKPEMKKDLAAVLTYHVVPVRLREPILKMAKS